MTRAGCGKPVIATADVADLRAVADIIRCHPRVVALTGAGCSTASGIPAYRDALGNWAHPPPVQYRDFITSPAVRKRYWARSFSGWPRIAAALPNEAHVALVRLESLGYVRHLVTQNVDGLHIRAGSRCVTELHGRLASVVCLQCGAAQTREAIQDEMCRDNPGWACTSVAEPDGDSSLSPADYDGFNPPACRACGGALKPDVVFFGETIPPHRAAVALTTLSDADAVLIIGSSLMVLSGFRLARAAAERGLKVLAINIGRTRADGLLTARIAADCTGALPALTAMLATAG